MASDHPHISFFIPAYNEEGHLRTTVEESARVLGLQSGDFEIIIVDDGSTDRTGEMAEELARSRPFVRVFHNDGNRGFGYTCRRAITESRGRYIGWVSADTTWEPAVLQQVIRSLGQADVITTYMTNFQDRTFLRRVISRSFTVTMNVLFKLNIKYYNGGCFHRAECIKPLKLYSPGLTLWAEILVRLLKSGHTCLQIGIHNVERQHGRSKAFRWQNVAGTLQVIGILIRDIYFRKNNEAAS